VTFRQFAFKNVQRNYKAYLAYFLSCTFSILVFFLFAVNLFHPEIGERFTSGPVHLVLSAGEIAVAVFSLLFIFYSEGSFLKTRSQEFGLLMMLGATRKQLNRLMAAENLIIGLAAMAAGMAAGLFLSKYFLLLASVILEVEELEFYWPAEAVALTAAGFLVMFILISAVAPLTVRSKAILELLKGNRKPKEPPKASVWLSAAGVLLIAAGYAIVVRQMAIPFDLGVIAVLVSAGTYLIYAQLSVFTLKRLTAVPAFFFRKTNPVWISDLVYRMKDNARLLFVVTITCTAAFTTLAAFYAIYQSTDEEYAKSYPLPFNYFSYAPDDKRERHLALIASVLEEEGLAYQDVSVPFREFEGGGRLNIAAVSAEGYNRLARMLNRQALHVQPGETVEVSVWTNKADTRIALRDDWVQLGGRTLKLVDVVQDNIFPEGAFGRLFVVSDADFAKLASAASEGVYYGYAVPDWTAASAAAEKIAAQIETDFVSSKYRSSPDWYKQDELVYKLILFVGTFISFVFFIAAGSFIYFRFYTDVQEDKVKFRNLRKIGLTGREVKKIVTLQLAILFFIPFAVAALHSVFALQTLQTRMAASIGGDAAIVLAFFFAALILYFLLLRSRYLRSLLEGREMRK